MIIRGIKSYSHQEKEIEFAITKDKKISFDLSKSFDPTMQIKGNGLTLFPGFIDMQVHLREPGAEYKENIKTGTLAAVSGGFIAVASMPNTNPTLDSENRIREINELIKRNSHCIVYPIPSMTQKLEGEVISPYLDYKKASIFAITDDGVGVQDEKMMELIFKEAKNYQLSIMQHCEQMDPKYSSDESEWKMIERDLNLLAKYGGHYHVLHLSTKKGLELITQAKRNKLNVTCEVSPHHLLLEKNHQNMDNTLFKMNPPLRDQASRQAMVEGLINGTIDYIATDHAPHSSDEKQRPYHLAPNGIIGLESCFSLIYTNFVKTKLISLQKLVELMRFNPQKIYQLPLGQLKEDDPAHFTLINLEESYTFDRKDIFSKSSNTPFLGHQLFGRVYSTCVDGKIVFERNMHAL